MNNPMSFNFFTASDKSELPPERISTFPLSSLLSWHSLLPWPELCRKTFLSLLLQNQSSSSCAWCVGLFKATQDWKTSPSPWLLSTTKITRSQQIKNPPTELSKPCSRWIRALPEPNRNYGYTGCVKTVLVLLFHTRKTEAKRVQDSMPHPGSGGKAVSEPKFCVTLSTSIQCFTCNNYFSNLCCDLLERRWQERTFSFLLSW